MSVAGRAVWADHTVEALRAAGYRPGGARSAVVELLSEQDCCLSAHEIHDRLRERDRRVGVASIYRALEVLWSLRLVQRLEVGDGTARYEPLLPSGEHHHHVVCDQCGKVDAFEDHALEDALAGLSRRLAYAIDAHDVVLHGACPDCSADGS
jgi:Fur family transcriptional regulator, ferric uptake regulator